MPKPDWKEVSTSRLHPSLTTLVDAEDGTPLTVSIRKDADGVVLIHFGHRFTLGVTGSNLNELRYIVDIVAAELYGSPNSPDKKDAESSVTR
jgi:hypothetical protein